MLTSNLAQATDELGSLSQSGEGTEYQGLKDKIEQAKSDLAKMSGDSIQAVRPSVLKQLCVVLACCICRVYFLEPNWLLSSVPHVMLTRTHIVGI